MLRGGVLSAMSLANLPRYVERTGTSSRRSKEGINSYQLMDKSLFVDVYVEGLDGEVVEEVEND